MRRRDALLSIGCLLATFSLTACGGGPKTEESCCEANNPAAVLFMSFNIRYGTANDGDDRWPNRRQMVFDVIRKQNADFLGLQEALRFQIDEILDACRDYAFLGVGREDAKDKGEFSPILYKKNRYKIDESGTFWLSDTPEVVGSMTWGNKITRVCTWARFIDLTTGQGLYVFNTHFDHQSQPSRVKSAELVMRRIAARKHTDEPFILMGDFNAGEDNPAIGHIKAGSPIKTIDTFRHAYPDVKEVGTFHGFKGGTERAKIDYVFAQPDVKILDAAILYDNVEGKYPSDHYPVTAKLLFPRDIKK